MNAFGRNGGVGVSFPAPPSHCFLPLAVKDHTAFGGAPSSGGRSGDLAFARIRGSSIIEARCRLPFSRSEASAAIPPAIRVWTSRCPTLLDDPRKRASRNTRPSSGRRIRRTRNAPPDFGSRRVRVFDESKARLAHSTDRAPESLPRRNGSIGEFGAIHEHSRGTPPR